MKEANIALLGATGYIGRSLLAQATHLNVTPFSRDAKGAQNTLSTYGIFVDEVASYEHLLDQRFDVVINATGVGSPKVIAEDPLRVFSVTEAMDALVDSYLTMHSDTQVFNISSGAVYGKASNAVSNGTLATFDPATLNHGDCYALAKLSSEARHRVAAGYSIIDLRVFAFVSQWLDPDEAFLIAEIASCLQKGAVLTTASNDMVRDYSTAGDLWHIIEFLFSKGPANAAYDVRSLAPVSKFALLDKLHDTFGLRYKMNTSMSNQSPTGLKSKYYSESDSLSKLGYTPGQTALENVVQEIGAFLEKNIVPNTNSF